MRGIKFVKEHEAAIKLRKHGFSIAEIEKKLSINRSTLSPWIKDIKLGTKQKRRLLKHWRIGLFRARQKAVKWHHAEKTKRIAHAKLEAIQVLKNLNLHDKNILELALAFLYLGEGFKSNDETGIGNSDPLILKVFLKILQKNYSFDIDKIRCELYLRADQDGRKMKRYWSRELHIPVANFRHVSFDKRTIGSKTFKDYKGVCSLRCSNVAIQRKLLTISREFCRQIIKRV